MAEMKEVIVKSLQKKLLSVLRLDDFWKQFMEVVGEELALQRTEIEKRKYLFDVNVQLEDGLLDIAETFGYTPNLIIDNSLLRTRKEVESIPFRIRNKTTYDGYYINFKQINQIGDIYNFYWSGKKVIKAILFDQIMEALGKSSFTQPFIDIYPDKNFSTIFYMNPVILDDVYSLDVKQVNGIWHLDSDTYIIPSKHLSVEYYLTKMLDEKFLITSDYFRYLEEGVEYNRRVPIIPHCGVQLVAMMAENSGFDHFDNGAEYSVPALKMKCATVTQYNKFLIDTELFRLDNEEGKGLDEIISWRLDNDQNTAKRLTADDFRYISCGNGVLSIPDVAHKNIFNFGSIALFYTFGDNDNSYLIKDYSTEAYDAMVTGDTKKVQGIVGKTVNFNGVTSVTSDRPIPIVQNVFSLGFWLNANDADSYSSFDLQYILDFSFMKVWYVYSEQKLYYTFGNTTGSADLKRNKAYQVIFELENSQMEFRLYLNGQLTATHDISTEGITGDYVLTIGADSNKENNFIGIIDSLWILTKILTQAEKDYIFKNKLGIITQLANKLAVYELDIDHETYENNLWLLVQSYIRANDITEEFGFFVDKSKDSYTGKLNFFPIMPEYITFVYLKGTEEITITADENGKFYNKETDEFISGSVNYSTGEYVINRKMEKYVTQDILASTKYNTQSTIKKTAGSDVSYWEIRNEALEPLAENKLVDNTDAELVLTVSEYSVTGGDEQHESVYSDGTKDSNGNLVYYTDFFCKDKYEPLEGVPYTISEEPVAVYDYYDNSTVITPVYHIDTYLKEDLRPNTVNLKFSIKGVEYSLFDDGNTIITGNSFNGRINYETGRIEGDFLDGEYPDDDIIISYTYYMDLGMNDGSAVTFAYKVTDSVNITEIGLENENHELLAYMTFPPIQFNSINNHVSALFAIRKL